MVPEVPSGYIHDKPDQIKQLFRRKRRFRRELRIPDEMLRENILETVSKMGWATTPYAALKASEWLEWLNKTMDSRLEDIYRRHKDADNRQWLAMLSPTRKQVRRVLEELAKEGKLERRKWFREVGRPAIAYHFPAKAPFLEARCSQCAFYVSVRRKCNLWWLVDKKYRFFDQKWKQADSPVTRFEIHKMAYGWKIGPHSSACNRFLDKKRDYSRKDIPGNCDVCGQPIPQNQNRVALACRNCKTKYVRFRDKVKVMTAYEHEYNRLYHQITGGNAEADLETAKKGMREKLQWILKKETETEDLDVLAEDAPVEENAPRIWPRFSPTLQGQVDRVAQTTDIAKRFSVAVAESARNATQRLARFARLSEDEAGPAIALQEKYLGLIHTASQSQLLTYEALIMKQYWHCFGFALRGTGQWFGPRKKSRFVMEFVEDQAGKARGYSALDAAINYLHQRRLRQAERINANAGFPGTCDGFLHRERYNSRGIGLLLDMIDPFKFADREELLIVALNGGISWRDFRLEKDRRGSTFYYPSSSGKAVLDRAGVDADNIIVSYQNRQMHISEAFKELASNLLQTLETNSQELTRFKPFVFA
jgi:CRISPR/Cas system-associated endonuclease Cas1